MSDNDRDFIQLLLTVIVILLVLNMLSGCAPEAAPQRPPHSITEKEYLLRWVETEIMNSCETGKPVQFGSIDGEPYFFVCRPGTGI